MKIRLSFFTTPAQARYAVPTAVVLLLCALLSVASETHAGPQNPAEQNPGTVSISAQASSPFKEANPGVEFSKFGGSIARPSLMAPKGAITLLQVSAPLGSSGKESVLVHLYRHSSNNALFAHILTAKGKQAGTRRNTIRLSQAFPTSPENLNVTIRYLEPVKRRGLMIVVSGEALHYVLSFPKGLGSTVTQQQFLTTSKNGTRSAYTFSDLDGRGFAIVKGTVVSAAGQQSAPEDAALQYFVWNGKRFVPRAAN
jgi:hypothetical protein